MSQPEISLSLDRLVEYLEARPGPEHPCPYLPDRQARMSGFVAESLSAELYHQLMDRGFRRSGTTFYRPACPKCRECVPLRAPVARFKPSRNQARVLRKNVDLTVSIARPECTRQKWDIYVRHLRAQHNGTMSEDFDSFREFLYGSSVESIEFVYRLGRRIVAVSIADLCPQALSTVYAFFEPDQHRRSLGTYSILREIEYCRRHGIPHYYLGYYVRDCAAMNYKARFRPHELLRDYRNWRAAETGEEPPGPA
jgi:arginine-tRNA-protein transferase